MTLKIVAVIPAHLASVRFPRKILFPFHGLPMIEHVRRRALLSNAVSEVYVATCDEEIAEVIRGYGGKVIMTANTHTNGTSRVAEAVKDIDCTHVMLLQGDEPLLLPRHLDIFAQAIAAEPGGDAWNATGPIDNVEELDRHSFVKCTFSGSNRIIYCFRRSPCYSSFDVQKSFVRKILGIIAYRKDFLLHLTSLPSSPIERAEFIEQMRIIENGYILRSIPVSPSLPSVNEPEEADIVLDYIRYNAEQRTLLERILS
ncbi:MAG: NTP transferase domain-containing protein [Deltaproteobacteria bacterium]|nr:NTP transferase domain-containing protein [Deltaproteobacteria bacterium]